MSLIKIFKLKFTLNRSTFICSLFIFSSSNLRKVVGPYCSQNCDCSGVILGQGLTGSRFLLRNKFWKTILLIWISMTLKGQSKVHTSDSSSQFGMSKIIQFFFLAFFNNFINEMFYFIKWFQNSTALKAILSGPRQHKRLNSFHDAQKWASCKMEIGYLNFRTRIFFLLLLSCWDSVWFL